MSGRFGGPAPGQEFGEAGRRHSLCLNTAVSCTHAASESFGKRSGIVQYVKIKPKQNIFICHGIPKYILVNLASLKPFLNIRYLIN
jgi:hypothetical protein